ncbi:MAG: hypothetical protein IK101_05765 [Oscillospiraceae bacterium]|nr:hypothetical protein [Oscillospiraceae bacterium]
MKKLLSIAVVLILILSFTVPALAATVNYPSVSNGDIEVTAEGDVRVVVEYAGSSSIDENSMLAAAKGTGKVEGDDFNVDMFEIHAVDAAGNKVAQNDPITFSFNYENADLLVAILIQNADGSWSEVSFSVSGSTVTINAPHLTPFALIVRPRSTTPTEPGETPSEGEGGSHYSPFTGDYTVIWAAVAVAMVLCAGAFLMSARKRTAE